ncbi:MAG: choice-of-anchor Q domain-containing protein [Xanthomonadales bacterium]|nr:choice-of-anchor Q domain-containing protein [Xanthomonadales bacterium]
MLTAANPFSTNRSKPASRIRARVSSASRVAGSFMSPIYHRLTGRSIVSVRFLQAFSRCGCHGLGLAAVKVAGNSKLRQGEFSVSKYQRASKYEIRQTIQPKIAPLTAAVSGALAAGSLQAATITVDSLDGGRNSGECTLRSALYASTLNSTVDACVAGEAGQDTIVFESSLSGTIDLSESDSELYFDGSTLPVGESVSIDGNNAITVQGTFGGPVFYSKYNNNYTTDTLEISGLTIKWGEADYGGGILSYGRRLELEDVTIETNEANYAGGGIWHEPQTGAGNLQMQNCLISGNEVLNDMDGKAPGVGVSMQLGGTVSIFNTSFVSNQTPSDAGGGGALSLDMDVAYVSIYNSSFTNNLTLGNGGGVWADLSYAVVDMVGNTFTGNNGADGGGLYLREQQGGVDQRAAITLENNTFDNNSASRGGGAAIVIANGDGGTNSDPVKFVDITGDNVFTENSATEGGALYLDLDDTVPATITGATFTDNEAGYAGGGAVAIRADASDVSVGYSSFDGNYASGSDGGGLQVVTSNASFYGYALDMANNVADGAGGGALAVSANSSEVSIGDSRFYFNSANACGGGVYITDSPSGVGLGSSVVYGNTALCGGGLALFTPGATSALVEVKYSEFSGNYASNSFAEGAGGGIFASAGGGNVVVNNSTISGNGSAGSGGGVSFAGSLTAEVKYSTIADNFGYNAVGGLYNDVSDCQISNAVFSGNVNQAGTQQDLGGSSPCDVSYSALAGAANSTFTDDGGNLLDIDPQLQPLSDNGGSGGFTHALAPSSPAIDAGDEGSSVPDYDQRGPGFPRQKGAALDMGAFEADPAGDVLFQDRFEQP